MKAIISLLIAGMLIAGTVFAKDLGRVGCDYQSKPIVADTVKGADSCFAVFCTKEDAHSWQFFLQVDTFFVVGGDSTAVADDSLLIMCRNIKGYDDATFDKYSIRHSKNTVWSPILWVSGQNPYTTSEWAVFDGSGYFESAAASDSSFVVGAGSACECFVKVASNDTVKFRLEPGLK